MAFSAQTNPTSSKLTLSEKSGFTSLEKRSVFALSMVYALRMYGLFLLLPVLSIYAVEMEGATPLLVGVAFGIYGLTQAILQIPFGLMSDRLGRKPVIVAGLLIFVIGSVLAAFSSSIYGVIAGRALQGAGAIAAAVIALTADLTRENQRTKAMAFIGMSIGTAFMVALVSAPSLAAKFGLNGLFIFIAILAIIALFVIVFVVPNVVQASQRAGSRDARAIPSDIPRLLADSQLIRLNIGIFILHMVLTAIFFVVPLIMLNQHQFETALHWWVYLPALLLSILAMIPLIIYGAKNAKTMQMFSIGIIILLFAQILFFTVSDISLWMMGLCVFFFFWGFNALEAMLPSLITRLSPAATKGTAIGIYNTFQFSGVFAGGLIGGYLYQSFGETGIFVFCGLSLLVWLIVAQTAPAVKLMESRIINMSQTVEAVGEERARVMLSSIRGVSDVILIKEEQLAYLKIDKKNLDLEALEALESGIVS